MKLLNLQLCALVLSLSTTAFAVDKLIYEGNLPEVLTIHNRDTNVELIGGKKFRISYSAKNNQDINRVEINYSEENGFLKVVEPHFSFKSGPAKLVIEIPSTTSLKIKGADGNVELSSLSLNSMTVEVDDGNVSAYNLNLNSLSSIKTGDGNITLVNFSKLDSLRVKIRKEGKLTSTKELGLHKSLPLVLLETNGGNVNIH